MSEKKPIKISAVQLKKDPVKAIEQAKAKKNKEFKDGMLMKTLSFFANLSDTIFRLFISLLALLFASLYRPPFIPADFWLSLVITAITLFNLPLVLQLVQTIFSAADKEVRDLEKEHQETAETMTVEAFSNMPEYIEEQFEKRQEKKYSDKAVKLQGMSRLPLIGKHFKSKLDLHMKKKPTDMSIVWLFGRPNLKRIMSKSTGGLLVSSSASYDKLSSDWFNSQVLKGGISIVFSIWFSDYIFTRIPLSMILPTLGLAALGIWTAIGILIMRFLTALKTKNHYKNDLQSKTLVMKRLNR